MDLDSNQPSTTFHCPGKKVRYLLPVLIPLALTIALYIEYLAKHFKELRKNESWPIYLHTIILIIIGYTIPIGLLYNNLMISSTPWLWSSFLVISSIICATLMWRYLKHKLLQKVFYTSILFLTSLIVFGMPLFKILYNNPAYEKPLPKFFHQIFPPIPMVKLLLKFFGILAELPQHLQPSIYKNSIDHPSEY